MGKLKEGGRMAGTLETENAVEQRAFKSARMEEVKRLQYRHMLDVAKRNLR